MTVSQKILRGLIPAASLFALTAAADDPADVKDEWSRQFLAAAQAYEMTAGESTPLKLVSRPILNWTNPERKTTAGSVFLWTNDGRPAAAMCIYPVDGGVFDHEFQSLATSPLQAKLDVSAVWWPREPGVSYVPLDDAKPPGKARAIRLTQMRAVARGFSARIVPPNGNTRTLRMLTAPLYRYPEPKTDSPVTDGAIFSFVQGTDPEVLLLVEAIRGDDGETRWQYALARMSMVPLEVTRDQEVVWKTDWAQEAPDRIYYTIHNNPAVTPESGE